MRDEEGFLSAIKARPGEELPRLVYADWLEERGDPRAGFVRLHWALAAAAPDHPDRPDTEKALSRLRKACDPTWLAVVEPERPDRRNGCACLDAGYKNRRWPMPYLHAESQDTECDGWKRLLDLVEEAAADGREEFAPLRWMSAAEGAQVVTLPPTIARLKAVRTLDLYGSHLVRVPPEVGEMAGLERFDPYTSYWLHWFPYELTRCRNLRHSRVSTRALYGNYKYRPPFPRLHQGAPASPGRAEPERLPVGAREGPPVRPCSVCGREFEDRRLHRVWVSLRVATDVLPLLVNACSEGCVARLPAPPDGYVPGPHKGGLQVQQPPCGN